MCVQGLQVLFVSHLPHLPMCDLLLLPSSITQLQFKGKSDIWRELPPELPQLSGLLQLKLSTCALWPAALRSLTCLQKLHLERCRLLPRIEEDLGGFIEFDVEGTAALLGVLRQMPRLQHLQLHLDRLDTRDTAPAAAPVHHQL